MEINKDMVNTGSVGIHGKDQLSKPSGKDNISTDPKSENVSIFPRMLKYIQRFFQNK